MSASANNVLLPLACPTQKSLRAAVAAIIRDIQREAHETDQETADRLGVSVGTIRNARNELTDLGAVTVARIGFHYGAHHIDPYHRLYGARAEVIEHSRVDPLVSVADAVATICRMRCSGSEGGATETPKERLDALPTLKEAARQLTAYIASIESLKVAA